MMTELSQLPRYFKRNKRMLARGVPCAGVDGLKETLDSGSLNRKNFRSDVQSDPVSRAASITCLRISATTTHTGSSQLGSKNNGSSMWGSRSNWARKARKRTIVTLKTAV